MTDAELDELERLANEATPGPWVATYCNDDGDEDDPSFIGIEAPSTTAPWVAADDAFRGGGGKIDVAFIVAARGSVKELIAEVRRLRRYAMHADDCDKWELIAPPQNPNHGRLLVDGRKCTCGLGSDE